MVSLLTVTNYLKKKYCHRNRSIPGHFPGGKTKQNKVNFEQCCTARLTKPKVHSLTFKATKIHLHLPSLISQYLYIMFLPLQSTCYSLIINPLITPVTFWFTSYLSARDPLHLHSLTTKVHPCLEGHLKCYLLSKDTAY